MNKKDRFFTLNVGDVCYKVFTPTILLEKISIGDDFAVFTHLHHTENDISLYGFATEAELSFFELLIGVSGVGPKSALGVLSVASLPQIKKAILRDDPSILSRVSGIGKKTAERLVVELKNKLEILPEIKPEDDKAHTEDTELFEALSSLGYKDPQIRDTLKQIPDDITDTSARLKQALKFLSQK